MLKRRTTYGFLLLTSFPIKTYISLLFFRRNYNPARAGCCKLVNNACEKICKVLNFIKRYLLPVRSQDFNCRRAVYKHYVHKREHVLCKEFHFYYLGISLFHAFHGVFDFFDVPELLFIDKHDLQAFKLLYMRLKRVLYHIFLNTKGFYHENDF